MHAHQTPWVVTLALLAVVSFPRSVPAQDAEVVIEWSRILLTTFHTPGAQSPTVSSHVRLPWCTSPCSTP